MKVLYISHMREPSGWGQAARDNIKALLSVGIDVVCRNVALTNGIQVSEDLIECEKKYCHDATHCIQHVLPYHYVGTDKYKKNIAYLECEGDLANTSWLTNLELMDEVWVPNRYIYDNLSWHCINTKVVYHPCDIIKYLNKYPEFSIPGIDHKFKFYTICDLNDRKNLESTIKCFHHEFDYSEQVALIIKVKNNSQHKDQTKREVEKMCLDIKRALKIYNNVDMYHKEIIISEDFDDDMVMTLHNYGDCFVNTSRGESWSIPSFDAMAFGKTPIVPEGQGMDEFVMPSNCTYGKRISTFSMIAHSQDSAFSELMTGQDFWLQIDERKTCEAMRYYYNNQTDRRSECYEHAKRFAYENVGKSMEKLLGE